MVADLSIWMSWIAGGAIALVLVGAIWWSLFADKSRGRARCPACWHDMTGAPSLRCPECGHEARSQRSLFATRRRWALALLFLAALVVGTLAFRFRVTQEGLATFAPTRVLLWMLPHANANPGPADDVQRELQFRLMQAEVDAPFLEDLTELIIRGDSAAPPGSPAWENRYGRLAMAIHERARNSLFSDDPALAASERFRELPARAELLAARATGAERALLVDLMVWEWWPAATEAEVTVTDASDGSTQRLHLDGATRPRPVSLVFAPASDAEESRHFEISMCQRPTRADGTPLSDAEWSEPTSQGIDLAIPPLPTVPELSPATTPGMDAAIDAVVAGGLLRWEVGRRPVAFRLDASRTSGEEFTGVLVGLELTLREGDVVRRRLHAWWPAGPKGGGLRFGVVEEDAEALQRFQEGAPGWTFEIRGDPAIAARAYVPSKEPDATAQAVYTKYWSGHRTMTATPTPMAGEAPRRRWMRLPPVSQVGPKPTGRPSTP